MKKIMLIMGFILSWPIVSLAGTIVPTTAVWGTSATDSTPLLMAYEKSQMVPIKNHEQNNTLAYTIDVRYPQITGTSLSAADNHFNQLVQSLVQQQVTAFKQDMANSSANAALPKVPSYLKLNYEMNGMVSQSQHTDFTSIRFHVYGYERGMAHPYHKILAVNYDLGHDKVLNLADLFNPNTKYLAAISDYCIQQLQAQKLPVDMVKSGAAPKFENYKNWNLVLGGLLITFDEAQVAPRYYGIQQVLIPNAVIAKMLTHPAACTLGVAMCDGS